MKDDPNDDVWAIMANNAGEQGSCGHKVIGAHIGDKKPFRLRLWRPTALREEGIQVTSVAEAPGTDFRHTLRGGEGRSRAVLDGQDAIIDISLPTPTPDVMVSQFARSQDFSGQGGDKASGFVEGELHLKWTARTRGGKMPTGERTTSQHRSVALAVSPGSSSSRELYLPQAFTVEPVKLDPSTLRHFAVDNDEEVLPHLLEQVPPEKREALRLALTTPKATAVEPTAPLAPSGPPAATPPFKPGDPPLQWHRSAGSPSELVQHTEAIRAMCEAFNGNIPHSPAGTCPKEKQTPPDK